MNGAILRQKK